MAVSPGVGSEPTALIYRTGWRRVGAALVDSCVLLPLSALGALVSISHERGWVPIAAELVLQSKLVGYSVALHAWTGQTVGKWLLGVQVQDEQSRRTPRLTQAMLRDAVPVAVAALMGLRVVGCRGLCEDPPPVALDVAVAAWWVLDLATMLFDRRRRSLHDHVAGTVVVRVPARNERRGAGGSG